MNKDMKDDFLTSHVFDTLCKPNILKIAAKRLLEGLEGCATTKDKIEVLEKALYILKYGDDEY